MIVPASARWFAGFETRLAWRDLVALMTAGHRWRTRSIAIGVVLFMVILHAIAYALVGPYARLGVHPDKTTLVVVTGTVLLSWSVMLAQAMETVTRGLYARADLDLILSSPASARLCFAVRIAAMPVSITLMTLAFAAPFINILALRGGARWFCAYGVVIALALLAVGLALVLTMLLFRILGPRRTRLASQIVAAVIGAAFVICLQVAAILSYGTLSRTAYLQSPEMVAAAPDLASPIWLPARAICGDVPALAGLMAVAAISFALAIALLAGRFAVYAQRAVGQAMPTAARRSRERRAQTMSPARLLRRKEWTLLARDPWLMSQSLMQLLYLAPPALLLWRSFGHGSGGLLLLVPVLVMASGQLSGGLAWLAISGEDAPDLIATAPVSPRQILRAKVEAVLGAIAIVFAPFILALSFLAPTAALAGAGFILVAAASATLVQLWFRAQAKRSYFRRRQTSSRIATFAEALSSVGWAATAGFAAQGSWLALAPGVITLLILLAVRALSPAKTS